MSSFTAVVLDALQASIGLSAAVYALSGIGINLQFGYTGILNLGQVGFMLVGAYGVAITHNLGGSLWLGILVGLAAAVVFGLLLGLPTLRLRADYLAIVTLAAAEILRLVVRARTSEPVTRSTQGIVGVAKEWFALNPIPTGRYGWDNFSFDQRALWMVLTGWTLVGLIALLMLAITRSPWGRVLHGIREDEDVARALGKNVYVYKMQTLILGGAIGALAGILLAVDAQSVFPDTWTAQVTFLGYVIVILGGPGRVLGPVVGSILYWFIIQFTDGVLQLTFNHIDQATLAPVRFIGVGVGLILLMAFRPQGLLGDRRALSVE